MSREDKLKIIAGFRSIRGIGAKQGWDQVVPDDHANIRADATGARVVLRLAVHDGAAVTTL